MLITVGKERMSSEEYLSSKKFFLERLQQLDDILNFPETSVDIVHFFFGSYSPLLIQEFRFLDIFLSLQSITDEPDMLHVTRKVQTLFQEASLDFSKLYLAQEFDFCTPKVQEKIRLIKMEIRAKYSFPKISSLTLSVNDDGVAISKFVKDFVNTVVKNLRQLFNDPSSLLYVPETKEHIEDVLKELTLLEKFICFISERFIEPLSQHHAIFFAHAVAVAGHASMLSWLYLPDLAPEEINALLSDFLGMSIKPILPSIRKIYTDVLQALKLTIQSGYDSNIQNEHSVESETNLVEIILHKLGELRNSSQRVALKDRLTILQEIINLLGHNIICVPSLQGHPIKLEEYREDIICVPKQDLESLLQDIRAVIIDVGLLVYSLYEDEYMALGEVNLEWALDLLENMNQRLSTMVHLTIRKAFESNLPGIHGLGYVDFLLSNLKELQSRHADSLDYAVDQLQVIEREFEGLQSFLVAVSEERYNDIDKIQLCATHLISEAHVVEYVVDACIRKNAPVWCLRRWLLLDILEEITLIRDEVAVIPEKKMVGDATDTVIAPMASNLTGSPRMNDEFVGFEDEIQKLRDQLIKGTKGRDVISIVGMPGLGKTTLANKLYFDSLVVSRFDIRAQCCVSQEYSRKDLLLALLHDATGEDSEHRTKEADELADKLRKALFSKRYLILVDDVWDTRAWDDLIGCFPDSNYGSRIILTTRNHEVASHARFCSDPFPLRMFNDDESWDLLRKKVFGEESWLSPLTKFGQQILKRCGGSPLSVVLVAGILAGVEKKEECWEQVANNLGTYIHKDSRAIIEHSYQNLPYHLRSCFLYFGVFREDNVISVSKLIRLWISEGFIKSCEGKSVEDIAEGYLEKLLGRNLVMGTKKSYGGKIEACHMHDLLHDFCKERAKEENFLLWIKRNQNANPSYRTSIGGVWPILKRCSSQPHVGSIISLKDWRSYDIFVLPIKMLRGFRFLKVLDLGFSNIISFPVDLFFLRYFSARILRSRIPSSLPYSNWNLETLILAGYDAPFTFCEMVKLRYLAIRRCRFTIENEELLNNCKSLYDLRTFYFPHFSSVHDMELLLRKTPNLQDLRCQVKAGAVPPNLQYYALNFSTRMEKLEIVGPWKNRSCIPFCISAPNLKNLTLNYFLLHPQHLSQIASLQNLQVLELKRIGFDSKEWKVRNGEFPQLKVLELIAANFLIEWNVADDAFCNLERLVLRDCMYLKEIPSCFGEISTLKSIEVKNCNEFVNKSAMDIRETQVEDYQNTGFQVFIITEENHNPV